MRRNGLKSRRSVHSRRRPFGDLRATKKCPASFTTLAGADGNPCPDTESHNQNAELKPVPDTDVYFSAMWSEPVPITSQPVPDTDIGLVPAGTEPVFTVYRHRLLRQGEREPHSRTSSWGGYSCPAGPRQLIRRNLNMGVRYLLQNRCPVPSLVCGRNTSVGKTR